LTQLRLWDEKKNSSWLPVIWKFELKTQPTQGDKKNGQPKTCWQPAAIQRDRTGWSPQIAQRIVQQRKTRTEQHAGILKHA